MSSIATVSPGRRQASPLLLGIASIAATYLFIAALAAEDRAGQQTLAWLALPVVLLRGLGSLISASTERFPVVPALLLLGVAATLTLVFLRRCRPRSWREDIALALLLPALLGAASLMLGGYLVTAALSGLLAGMCLLDIGAGLTERELSSVLVLVPIGLGALLRFYALAQVPNGYAEHAVVHHVTLSIPYFEALTSSLQALRPQPFLGIASNALIREQFGFPSLVAALGYELFGVTLTVTRLVSAALGTLSIYIAYHLGRTLGGVRLGLVFAFLLAVSPWHITISRYGDQEHVISPLQLMLSLLFVLRAVNGGRVHDIVLAALFTALSWYIYGANLVVWVIVGLFLVCRAALAPRQALANWRRVLLGCAVFAIISYPAVTQIFPQGFFAPNLRTGYGDSGPLLADFPKRSEMVRQELAQLFKQADDPWFSINGGGLGVLQSTLLLPGLLLALTALRQPDQRDLALLVLLGLPIGLLPAVFAPDPSFRRLFLVATLAALLSAATLLRLADAARAAGVSRQTLSLLSGGVALIIAAAGTYAYFDRVVVIEEAGRNGIYRSLGETVAGRLGKQAVLVVVPGHDNLNDTHRYIKLIAYDTLLDAQRRNLAPEALYQTTTCEDPIQAASQPAAGGSQLVIVIHEEVLEPQAPCGPEYLARLKAANPASTVLIANPLPSNKK